MDTLHKPVALQTYWLIALQRVPYTVMMRTGEERFKASANQDRVAELELLQNYLKGAVEKLDSAVQGKVAPMERMKKLLMSKDKKAMLLEMAGTSTAVKVPTTLVRCIFCERSWTDSLVHHCRKQ